MNKTSENGNRVNFGPDFGPFAILLKWYFGMGVQL